MAIPEKVLIENKSLKEVFKKDFLESILTKDGEIFPVNIMFIHETEENGKKIAFPIIISHGDSQEVKDKKLHLESPNQNMLEKFINALENKKDD